MKTVLILSGGMDSATLLYDLLAQGDDVDAIGVNYKQRHGKELDCAAELCRINGVRWDVLDLSSLSGFLTGSSQSDLSVPVPFGRYDEPTMKLTVVPNRNMFMLAAAGAVAIARKADRLAYGAHSGDHTIYPDCRPEFVEAMGQAFRLCDWHSLQLCAPYINMTKGDVCRRGVELAVPFELTWTCYVGGVSPCGKCGACNEREEAFEVAGIGDPLCRLV
ncbi:MAG: 7-cyano-7-deazaguanine synthase QueC [Chloroflexi bacterium]|nr:7-cyano-7-deazaguanine synthase QueC [Chloroflexota bacterium]